MKKTSTIVFLVVLVAVMVMFVLMQQDTIKSLLQKGTTNLSNGNENSFTKEFPENPIDLPISLS